ncbi:MAG TPA: hypothetical protein VLB80_01505 [Candidatus Babeliales bacterium]|nr:hypothetical protein [Candidatus Babeliales bacterium]
MHIYLFFSKTILLLLFVTNYFVTYGMLSRSFQKVQRPVISSIKQMPAGTSSGQQKRTIYTPEKLYGLYEPFSEKARSVSPLYGAAKYESKVLEKMYSMESETSAIQLVQELFHKQGPQFKPTENKSKAAYSLTPEIIGLILGALESGKLNDEDVRKYIFNEWRIAHKILTDGSKLSDNKINKVLNLIVKEYEHDKESARSIVLVFYMQKQIRAMIMI